MSATEIQKRVIPKATNGSIILFHNAALHTPEALPGIIEALQKDGFELIKVNDLIYKDNYNIDHAGKQIRSPLLSSSSSAVSIATTIQPRG